MRAREGKSPRGTTSAGDAIDGDSHGTVELMPCEPPRCDAFWEAAYPRGVTMTPVFVPTHVLPVAVSDTPVLTMIAQFW